MLARQSNTLGSSEHCSVSKAAQAKVIERVYRHSGIHLGDLTCQFVETRLRRRMRALNIDDAEAYVNYVDEHRTEVEHLVNAFTTNETCFFRTRPLWDYLANRFFPELIERGDAKGPAFWSAACSTGEEAYSLAMLGAQAFEQQPSFLQPRIIGTDISTDVLAKAKEGRYSGRNIRRLQSTGPEMLDRHFVRDGDDHCIVEEIKKRVQFKRHNLMESPIGSETFDLVMLRNVLIYFNQSDQIKIVNNIVQAMRPGAVLAIGESESLGFFDSGLVYVQPFVYQKPLP